MTRSDLNNAAAYALGLRLRVAMPSSLRGRVRRLASAVRHPVYIPHWFSPIAFVRYREFQYAFAALSRFSPHPKRMLDISSPKLFPVTVAQRRPDCEVHAVDLVEPDLKELEHARDYLGLSNLKVRRQDARAMEFEDESFDVVTSISVFEHIAPEEDGELPAVREVFRVLKPGGIAILIVPFAREYFAEYVQGAVYERNASDSGRTFYQRFYDMPRLERSIIQPSGMELVDLKFIDERHPSTDPHRRYAQSIAMNHGHITRYGLFYPILSRLLLSGPRPLEACRKPYIACLTLKKP